MTTNRMNGMSAFRLLCLVLVVGVCVGCQGHLVRTPVPEKEAEIVWVDSLDGTGQTRCTNEGNEPIILLHTVLRGSPYFNHILAHERIHVEQMRKYQGGCRAAVLRYMQDAQFKFEVEAQAYCKAGVISPPPGLSWNEYVDTLREYMNRMYNFGISPESLYDRIETICQREVYNAFRRKKPPPQGDRGGSLS